MPNPPSAAQSLYPHLVSGSRPVVQQSKPNTADAMFPAWSREAKQREADQKLWDECRRRAKINARQGRC